MDATRITILLVEDNPGDVRLLKEVLREVTSIQVSLTHVARLEDAVRRLAEMPCDLVLLDLSLPDAHGLDTVLRMRECAPDLPIIVLTGNDDEALSLRALQAGAQDYLVKGEVTGGLLVRAIRYAIERHRLQEAVRGLSLMDDLTGLYNRRGFLTFAEQHLKLATRTHRGLTIVFADLDGLKEINDSFLHPEGDAALAATAEVLKETFRESDIIARVGGDEFAVIAFEADGEDGSEAICARIQQRVDCANHTGQRPYRLSLSVGVVHYDPAKAPRTIDALLAQADILMYAQKRAHHQAAEAAGRSLILP